MRSSLFSRINDIGVYRALGVKKFDIYKIFLSEILIITAITSLLGVFTISFVVNKINEIIEIIYYPWYVPIVTLAFMFINNTLVGLLPVYNLMRLTPSQILSKYDI